MNLCIRSDSFDQLIVTLLKNYWWISAGCPRTRTHPGWAIHEQEIYHLIKKRVWSFLFAWENHHIFHLSWTSYTHIVHYKHVFGQTVNSCSSLDQFNIITLTPGLIGSHWARLVQCVLYCPWFCFSWSQLFFFSFQLIQLGKLAPVPVSKRGPCDWPFTSCKQEENQTKQTLYKE